jgi:predicted GH43/DUF377 family glycosyl hydrolase
MRRPMNLLAIPFHRLLPLFAMAGLMCGQANPLHAGQPGSSNARQMMWSDQTRLGRPFAKDPCVIRFGKRYLMYFSLPPFSTSHPQTPKGWAIGIAQSANLIDWEKVGEVLPEQPIEEGGICAPCARVLGGEVHLFYQTYGRGMKNAICHGWSSDGIVFARDPTNPVFHPSGSWTNGRAIDAEVIPFNGQIMLYGATRDPTGKIQLVFGARADPKSGFSRGTWKQIGDGPLLSPQLPWEQQCIEAPSVCERNGKLFMFYAGAYDNAPQQVGVATSRDGVTWKRLFAEPFLANGRPGNWNSSESGHPDIFNDEDGKSYLFFQGNNTNGQTWWLSKKKIDWNGDIPTME